MEGDARRRQTTWPFQIRASVFLFSCFRKKHFSVREETSQYTAKKNEEVVPQNFYDELEKDFELYQKGKLEAKSWDEFKQGLKERINILS